MQRMQATSIGISLIKPTKKMVVKPAKTMDLTMEMVKKSRLFQQNGGENPQLATING